MNINAIPSALDNAEKAAVEKINAISDHIAGIGTKTLPSAISRLEGEVADAKTRLDNGAECVRMSLLSLLTHANVFVSSLDLPDDSEQESLPAPKTKKITKKT